MASSGYKYPDYMSNRLL